MKSRRLIRGVVMVEVALTMMVFVAMIMLFLWLSLAMNARTSLTISIAQALRWGVTRGSESPFGDIIEFNEAIKDFKSGGVESAPPQYSSRFKTLLYQRGRSASESTAAYDESWLSALTSWPIFGSHLRELPVTYTRSLMGVHEYMRLRVGASHVRYPCRDEAGCLHCKFLNPGYTAVPSGPQPCSDMAQWDAATGDCQVGINEAWGASLDIVPSHRIVLECTYFPDFGFFTTAMKLLGGTGKVPKVKRVFSVAYTSDY